MRVLHILDHSIPLHSGYTFRTMGILRAQRALGWETRHLTTPRHRAPGPEKEEVDGLEFHRTRFALPSAARLPVLREALEMLATERRLDALIGEFRPDVLHAHSPVLNAIPALRAGRRFGVPVVYEVRAFWEDAAVSEGACAEGGWRYRLSRRLEEMALRRAQAVVTICEGLKGDMAARGVPSAKITVVPNAVDLDRFTPQLDRDPDLARRFGLGDGPTLGFVGSFYRYEGLDLAIRALPAIVGGGSDVRLLLAGGGPEEESLRRLAEATGVADRVIFAGRVPHRDVARLCGLIDLFVFPRRSHRLTELVTPLKPLEAMAAGRIALASDVGGHRELVRDGSTGFLFPPDNPDHLAAGVRRAMDNHARWPDIAARARRFVEQHRTWPQVVRRYEEVYRDALSAGQPAAGRGGGASAVLKKST